MTDPVPQLFDAFGKLVGVGDEIATILYSENDPFRGIVIKIGKNQFKVRDNYHKSVIFGERWISRHRSIKLRSKEEIEQD
jgi:hypothetical protein